MSTIPFESNGSDHGSTHDPAKTATNAVVVMLSILSLASEDETRLERDEEQIGKLFDDFSLRLKIAPDQCPVHTPLRVFKRAGKYPIIAGNNRYFAALRLGLAELPCIIEAEPADEAQLVIEMVKDNELHRPYTALERARNILRVVELRDCSQGEAARLLGISESDATKAIAVLKRYPADLHCLIGEGGVEGAFKVPVTSAYLMTQLADEAKIRELTDRVVRGTLTRDRLDGVIKDLQGKKKPKERDTKPATVIVDGCKLAFKPDASCDYLKGVIAKLAKAVGLCEKNPPEILPALVLQSYLK